MMLVQYINNLYYGILQEAELILDPPYKFFFCFKYKYLQHFYYSIT